MNSIVPVATAIGTLAFFWWMIRLAKRQLEERRNTARELGFTNTEEIPADLTNRVEAFYGKRKAKLTIRNLFIRGCGRYDLYVFDLTTGHNSDGSEWTAAIVSHDLKLPQFRIFPAMPFTGVFAIWIDKLIKATAAKQGFAESKANLPEKFAAKYRLYVKDEQACQRAVPEAVWGSIAELGPTFTLQGQDDFILFNEIHKTKTPAMPGNRRERYRDSLRKVMEQSDRLHHMFCDHSRAELVH